MFVLLSLLACQDYTLRDPPLVPVATPPGEPSDERGAPPNWQNCLEGYLGEYSNLTIDHPDVEPERIDLALDPDALDWWDTPRFQRFDAGLDFGANWWPVDDGLAGDPAYFSARWRAWIRAWSNTTVRFTYGSADDAWILVNDEIVFADPGVKDFVPETREFSLGSGQYPLEVRFAHRSGQSGFRFRVLSGDVSICYGQYD